MKHFRMNLALIALGLFAAPGARAVTYYVATTGNNANNGTSTATPFRTVDFAVNLANPGDVIEVRGGTYAENVVVRRSGTSNAWITLRAFNGETPLIKSTGTGPTIYVYHGDCDEDTIGDGNGNLDCHPMYWELRGLTVQGSPNGDGDGNVIKIDTPRVRLVANRLCCAKADIVKMVRTSNDIEIRDNEIWQDAAIVVPGANAQGIDMVGGDRLHVWGNYVHDVPDIGIYAKGNAREALIERNLLVNIGRADNGNALMLGQETDADRLLDGDYESYDGLVRNNVVVNATWACLATSSSSNARFYNNSCYNTGTTSQASILLTNESEIETPGVNLTFVNNIVYGNTARSVVKIGSDAMALYSTLKFSRNIYYTSDGAPRFESSDHFAATNFTQWQTRIQQLTTHADTSIVANPRFAGTVGQTPLSLQSDSPAINAGDDAGVLVPNDFLGVSRPIGPAYDTGAYEYGVEDRYLCDGFENQAGC